MAEQIKHYDFSKKPLKPSPFWMWIARMFAIKPRLKGRPVTVEKINMDGIRPPYLLFVTHASMLDFPAMYTAVAPYNANNVVAIDAIRDVGDWLMRRLGCICKRKFVKDLKLVQTCEGTYLTCTAYGEKCELFWAGTELESVHIEYDYPYRKDKYKNNIFGDCIDISTPDDSYWLHPVGLRDQLTKISFATEEIYLLAKEMVKERGKKA